MRDFTAVTELPASQLNAQQMARIRQRYQLAAGLAGGKRVLDVACGAGIGLGLLERSAASLVGCDLTYGVLATAQRHYRDRVPLAGADAQRLPFASGVFDLVISFEAIYYLPRPAHFLAEARRVLAPAGHLLIGSSNPDWPPFVPGRLSVHYPNLVELTTQLRETGFGRVEAWGALPTQSSPADGRLHWRQRWMAAARRVAQRIPLLAAETAAARLLKRLLYGRLVPLPAELLPTLDDGDPHSHLTTIDPTERDRRHRVLFVRAEARG
ncbi:MAG: methyltransferase domain-containing protein [Caldilineaceae bacterium]|nr:methyltransferase domain-containing protein [Caldilineaceae bacterium]